MGGSSTPGTRKGVTDPIYFFGALEGGEVTATRAPIYILGRIPTGGGHPMVVIGSELKILFFFGI